MRNTQLLIASVSLHSESSISKYLQFPILDARPFKIKYRRLPYLFVFICPQNGPLEGPKISNFAILKNREKIPGNYCMSKGDFPHLIF